MSEVSFLSVDYHGDYLLSLREIYGIELPDAFDALMRWENQIIDFPKTPGRFVASDGRGYEIWAVTEGATKLYVRYERASALIREILTPEYALAFSLKPRKNVGLA